MRRPSLPFIVIAAACLLHLSVPDLFGRALLRLDDEEFIGPFASMDLEAYFTEWLPGANHYAFPVRDLSFFADFWIERNLGLRSFLLQNVLWFGAYLAALACVLRRLFPARPAVALGILAVCAFHPANVEIVQWVTSRKHLMAASFLACAVAILLRPGRGGGGIGWGEAASVTFLYFLALGCYPSSVAACLWFCYAVGRASPETRPEHPRRGMPNPNLLCVAWLSLAVAYVFLVSAQNSDYGQSARSLAQTFGRVPQLLENAVFGIGRGVFQLVLPIRHGIYFEAWAWPSYAGLALLGAGAAAFWIFRARARRADPVPPGSAPGVPAVRAKARHARKEAGSAPGRESGAAHLPLPRHGALSAALLALALFTPQFAFVLLSDEFIMADRYLFLPLPYLLAALAFALRLDVAAGAGAVLPAPPVSLRSPAALGAAALCAGYALLSWRILPPWRSTQALFQKCVDEEESLRCLWHQSEEAFDAGNCPAIAPHLELNRIRMQSRPAIRASRFGRELAFYEGFCSASANNSTVAERRRELDEIAARFGQTAPLSFSVNLLSLEERLPMQAYEAIKAGFIEGGYPNEDMTTKLLGVIRGQLDVVCAFPEVRAAGCPEALSRFDARFANNLIKPRQVGWGRSRSAEAYNLHDQAGGSRP